MPSHPVTVVNLQNSGVFTLLGPNSRKTGSLQVRQSSAQRVRFTPSLH